MEESEEETVVDFAPPAEESQAEAPEKPETQGDKTNPKAAPSYAPEDLKTGNTAGQGSTGQKPKGQDEQTGNTPAAGEKNEKGEYYVPVFGWTLPSRLKWTIRRSQ